MLRTKCTHAAVKLAAGVQFIRCRPGANPHGGRSRHFLGEISASRPTSTSTTLLTETDSFSSSPPTDTDSGPSFPPPPSSSSSSYSRQKQREQEGLVVVVDHPTDQEHMDGEEIAPANNRSQPPRSQQYMDTQRRHSHANNVRYQQWQAQLQDVEKRMHELINQTPTGLLNEADWRDAVDMIYWWCTGGTSSISFTSWRGQSSHARYTGFAKREIQSGSNPSGTDSPRAANRNAGIQSEIEKSGGSGGGGSRPEQSSSRNLGIEKSRSTDAPGSASHQRMQKQPSKQQQHMASQTARISVDKSLALLERLIEEQEHDMSGLENSSLVKVLLSDKLVISIVKNWKEQFRRNHIDERSWVTPPQMLNKLDDFVSRGSSSGLLLTTPVYNMIMDAAIRQPQNQLNNKQAVRRHDRFSSVIRSRQETAEFVEQMLGRMEKESEFTTGTVSSKPNLLTYSHVMYAWSLVGDGPRTEAILQHVLDNRPLLKVDRQAFNTVLSAYARGDHTGVALDHCHSLLQRMVDLHKTEMLDTSPDAFSHNILLGCYANNPHVDRLSLEHAEAHLLGPMEGIRDTVSFNIVMDLWSKVGYAARVEKLLQVMFEEFQSGSHSVIPDIRSFNTVMAAQSKCGDFNAVERTFILMEQLIETNILKHLKPDIGTYSIIMDCWSKQVGKVPGAAERAEAILQTMKRVARKEDDPSLEPNAITYTTAIGAWAKEGNADRASTLLGDMMNDFLHRRNHRVKPDLTCFNAVLFAFSRSQRPDSVARIRAIMTQMGELSESHPTLDVKPNVISYNALLHAIARSKQRNSGSIAGEVMDEMNRIGIKPDSQSYGIAIHAYANMGDVSGAEGMLEFVCDSYYKKSADSPHGLVVKPTVRMFSAVMSAWSKAGGHNAPDKAQSLMERMREMKAAEDLDGEIDAVCYGTLLDCWANSGREEACDRAEALLQEMTRDDIHPTRITFNTLLKAFARAGYADRCQTILEKMVHEFKNGKALVRPGPDTLCTVLSAWSRDPSAGADGIVGAEILLKRLLELEAFLDVKANAACFNVVLECCSRSESIEACALAEGLLIEMEKRAATEDTDYTSRATSVHPNAQSYSIVINAFGRAGAAEKATSMLERMLDEYIRKGNKSLTPTIHVFNSALAAWANVAESVPESPARIESLIDRMERLHRATGLSVKPDVVSYNCWLDCLGKSKQPGASRQCESLLRTMLAKFEAGETEFPANAVSYNTLIRVLAESGNSSRASEIAEEMYTAYDLGTTSAAKPTLRTFNTVLMAHARSASKNPNAMMEAERILRRMEELHSLGSLDSNPDIVSYNILMDCIVKSAKEDAGEKCESILNELTRRAASGERSLKPTAVSYGTAINAWAKSGEPQRAAALLLAMCDAYDAGDAKLKPDERNFKLVLDALLSHPWPESGRNTDAVRLRMLKIYPSISTTRAK